jgi:hypothetical protein
MHLVEMVRRALRPAGQITSWGTAYAIPPGPRPPKMAPDYLTVVDRVKVPRERQTPEALVAMQKADAEKWWPLIKELGIKAE